MTDTELEKLHPHRRDKSACLNPDAQSQTTYIYELFMVQNLAESWFYMLVGRNPAVLAPPLSSFLARECNTITATP